MRRCIDEEGKIIATAGKKLHRNKALKDSASKMCISFNAEYITAFFNRENEINTMNTILKIVRNRIQDIPKSLVNYLEEVRDAWRTYKNSTEFKKYIAYDQKKYLDNKEGAALLNDKNLLK